MLSVDEPSLETAKVEGLILMVDDQHINLEILK